MLTANWYNLNIFSFKFTIATTYFGEATKILRELRIGQNISSHIIFCPMTKPTAIFP